MLNKYNADISRIFMHHRSRLILRPLLAALSILVVISTAYLLIQPGVTLESGAVSEQTEQAANSSDASAAVLTSEPTDTQSVEPSVTQSQEPTTESTDTQSTESTVTPTAEPSVSPTAEPTSEPTSEPTVTPTAEPSTEPTVTPSAEPSTEPSVTPSVTPTVTPTTEYSFENETICVKAILSENAVMPADAQLCVFDITQESDPERYSAFQKLLAPVTDEAAGASNERDLLAYDIGFFVDGAEVEPTGGSVQVTIDYKSPLIEASLSNEVNIYHVVETETSAALENVQDIQSVISAEGALESISFATDSFSAFIVPTGMNPSLHYLQLDQNSTSFTNTSYYNSLSPLGIAGSFHIVAFDMATLGVHTNGNILAKNLSAADCNFGTKDYGTELSYVQKYLKIVSGSSNDTSDILAIGSTNNLFLVDNLNHFAIAPPGETIATATQINQPQTIWQDVNTNTFPYINLDNVLTQIRSISSLLGSQPNSYITPSITDMNNASLTLEPGATLGVYKIKASELTAGYQNGINVYSLTGTTQNGNITDPNKITSVLDTVIINIDCENRDVSVPRVRMFLDGYHSKENYVRTDEVTSPVTGATGKIILNFINSAGVKITLQDSTYATIIAPDANIIVQSNVNGTIIGNNVSIQKETHRTDFTGSLPTGTVTAKKEWYANDGTTQLPAASIANLSVSVQLYCNNEAMTGSTYTVTLNPSSIPANSWTTTWSNLPVSAGQKYTVKEISISKNGTVIQTGETPTAYSVAYTNNAGIMSGTITIKNTEPDLKVDKLWKDSLGNAITPGASSVTIYLMRQTQTRSAETVETVTLSAATGWSYGWFGLPQTNAGGSALYYFVTETQVGGYAVTYANNSGIQNGIIAVTNTRGHPFVLPATGGSGTGVLYATGIVLLLSFFLLTGMKMRYRKRKGETSSA